MKNILAAYSTKNSISEIIEDLKEQFYGLKSQMLIYFASSNIDQEKLAAELGRAFPENILFGCSTAGEIVSGKMLKNSVVAMGFFNNIIKKA
ncbi:MAG: FIST N-terminal domain-containing protein, partial [Candidatus Eremiobacterota bacterium]